MNLSYHSYCYIEFVVAAPCTALLGFNTKKLLVSGYFTSVCFTMVSIRYDESKRLQLELADFANCCTTPFSPLCRSLHPFDCINLLHCMSLLKRNKKIKKCSE